MELLLTALIAIAWVIEATIKIARLFGHSPYRPVPSSHDRFRVRGRMSYAQRKPIGYDPFDPEDYED